MLDFSTLDDLAFAAVRGRLNSEAIVPRTNVRDLGPFLEFIQLAHGGIVPEPGRAGWLSLDGLRAFYQALTQGRSWWVCPAKRNTGFYRASSKPPEDDRVWTEFGLAAQRAALSVGFKLPVVHQLVGALGELLDNIYIHSRRPASGIVAFRADVNVFEFVVCDRGIGVLESLRTCREYARITDHADALKLTLSDGVSRFGAGRNRGRGFRPLFTGLANLWGTLRFRSGDHALVIDGLSPQLVTARPAQKPELRGFFVSVCCRVTAPPAG